MRRGLLILLALATFLPGAARAGTSYRCRVDGKTRAACCCGHAEEREATTVTRIERAPCCDALQRAPSVPPPALEPSAAPAAAPPLAIPPTPLAVAARPIARPLTVAARAQAPPGAARPVFARLCSRLL